MYGCKTGKGLKCYSFPIFRTIPRANITLGDHVNMGINLTIEVTPKGHITIGDHTDLTQNILISSACSIQIGHNVMIAERVSIRDTTHTIAKDKLIMEQPSVSAPIVIEDDVWIGANSIILQGTSILKGSVIAANSTLIAGTVTEEYGIYAGNPARLIGKRK